MVNLRACALAREGEPKAWVVGVEASPPAAALFLLCLCSAGRDLIDLFELWFCYALGMCVCEA